MFFTGVLLIGAVEDIHLHTRTRSENNLCCEHVCMYSSLMLLNFIVAYLVSFKEKIRKIRKRSELENKIGTRES